MKGTNKDVYEMMEKMLKPDLIKRILEEREKLLKADEREKMNNVIKEMNSMNCNKRIRDKKIAITSHRIRNKECKEIINTSYIYRMMFFNHYGIYHRR
jgi:hypothetical protein